MGSYVAGFYSDDNDLLITKHSAANVKCLDCHEATLGQQLREALAYVRGDYAFGDVTIGTREFCLSCHDWDEIVEATSDWTGKVTVYNTTGIYNPHNNHRGDADCLSCHSMHSQSILKCAECHEVAVPDGWLGYE
ncbi:MAG: cytochrome c3 family protein [Coriobacteriia bacterium]|nr:cytochrome c3 family protein [Coriobacteriia bacterium]